MPRKKRPKQESLFTGMALQKGWERVNAERAWWFYTAERFSKRWSLDGQGVPITWDETEYGAEQIREGTGNDVCAAILNNDHEEKLLLVVQAEMPTLLILGKRSRTIGWEAYAKEGLYTVKKLLPRSRLEAVVINPNLKTLERLGVIKPIFVGVVEETVFFKGGDSGGSESSSEAA
jgi:hypothetical protein